MTTSGLATPVRAARPRVPKPESRPPPRRPPHARAPYERVLGRSIAISILVHLLLLLLSPLVIEIGIPPGAAVVTEDTPEPFGLEMIVAIPSADAPEIPLAEAPRPEPVVPPRPRVDQPAATVPSDVDVPPSPVPGDQTTRSARDALRPGFRDPRLYVTPKQFPELEKTEHERYMEHLQARIDAVNDSMMIASNRERRTSDWTVTDGAGNRWGLSPDGLHLGGLTIPRELLPLPGATGDNASIQAEREQQRQRDEIRRQEEDRQRRETQDDRIDATRQDEERRRASDRGN